MNPTYKNPSWGHIFKGLLTKRNDDWCDRFQFTKNAEPLPEFHRKRAVPSSQRGFVSEKDNNYNPMTAGPLDKSCNGATLSKEQNRFLKFATI